MNRIRINVGKIGVITKHGDYQRIITAGIHWIGFSEEVTEYCMSKLYTSAFDFKIILKDPDVQKQVEIIDIKDNEIALQYENGIFKTIINAGTYFYWKGFVDFSFIKVNLNIATISNEIDLNVIRKPEVAKYVRSFIIHSYEEGLLFIDGKFSTHLNEGSYYFWNNSISIDMLKTDKRQQQMEISGQEILTKDKAALRINFYAQYQVTDVKKALMDNKNYDKQLYIIMQLVLREFIGKMTLDELLDNKESISDFALTILNTKSMKLGVNVLDCGVRDIILPGEVKQIMNQVLVAQKQAQANTIMRREETASTRSLLNTAKLMENNTMLYKLKEMEYIEKIALQIGEVNVSGGGKVVDQLKEIFTK